MGGLKAIRPESSSPIILGYDGAGVVESVGKDVTDFKAGDDVFVRVKDDTTGCLAEYCVAKSDLVAMKPSNCSMEDAAAMPLAAVTALQALRRIGLKEGDSVLITGGAGGVGTFAIQLAKKVFKAGIVATTASPGEKTELVKSCGADVVINYREQKFEEDLKDYDCAFDTTGESAKMPQIVKKGGKITTIADTPTVEEFTRIGTSLSFVVRTFLNLKKNKAAVKAANMHGNEWSYLFLTPNGKDLAEIAKYVEAGQVKAIIDNVWSFKDFNKAVERNFSGRAAGKCVVRIDPEKKEEKNEEKKEEPKAEDTCEATEEAEKKEEPKAEDTCEATEEAK